MGWIRIATVYKLPAQWINMSQEKTNCVFCFHFPELSLRLFITSSFRAVDTAPVTHSAPLSFQPIVSTSHDSNGWDTSSQEQKDGCYAALFGFFVTRLTPYEDKPNNKRITWRLVYSFVIYRRFPTTVSVERRVRWQDFINAEERDVLHRGIRQETTTTLG